MPLSRLNAEVLGKLLVALQALDALPDEEGMAAFLRPTLREVPGIADVFVCMDGRILDASLGGEQAIASFNLVCPKGAPFFSSAPRCLLPDRPDIYLVAMRTPRRHFGCLQLVIDDAEQLAAYKPFLVNIGHRVATIMENRENMRLLAEAGARLNTMVEELEDRVRERTRELQESELHYRLLTENASDVVMLLTPDWRYEWVSDPVAEILGWRPPDLVGRAVDEFVHPGDQARCRQLAVKAQDEAASVDFRFRRPDDSYMWVACRTRMKVDPDGTPVGVVGAMVDITDRKAAEAELAFAASHDPLTGLANRTMLVEEADRALAAGRRSGRTTALLMADLDHFKNINDSLGHLIGDELLCAVADRMTASVRHCDLVARHGGDEFVVLLPELADITEALRLAERLVADSRAPIRVGGTDLYATASVGIAVVTPGVDPVRGAVDLIREADTAMYVAKSAGRNCIAQFTDDLRRVVDDRLHLESDLRHALARNELAVWYQPEINMRDGSLMAAEALVRWRHPDGQLRGAAEFIEVAEETGLILEMGAWMLRQACVDAARWTSVDPGSKLVLRANLSPPELGQSCLLGILDEALALSGFDPQLLCVEITETSMLSDNATVKANLEGIRARGVELAIDDFGTGYGSLTYLHRYPINVLKIDRSFVTNITTNTSDRDLVAGVVALADRLGIAVTAEGVETTEQEQILASMGCAGAQGYLYSRALPMEEWTQFIEEHRAADVA
jgi:diguanylate cyclase (GGDEF)-like protein/PAS domain S-box-containing protein